MSIGMGLHLRLLVLGMNTLGRQVERARERVEDVTLDTSSLGRISIIDGKAATAPMKQWIVVD